MSVLRQIVRLMQLVAVIGALVFAVALFANEPDPIDSDAPPVGTADGDGETPEVDGAAVYSARCASCHGRSGQGGTGPRLADGQVVERFPDVAAQIQVVSGGRGGMPAFEGRLSAAEIEAVVEYTRSL